MATIAHYRQVLKRDFFPQRKILSGFLSARDILPAAQQAGHLWRQRIWTPSQTLWAFLVQVRHPGSSWQASATHQQPWHRLSFAGAVQHLNAVAPYLWLFSGRRRAASIYTLLLEWIAHDLLPHRPNRIEPRVKKRRPKEYGLLHKPRAQMRKELIAK